MNELSYNNWTNKSDTAIEKDLGAFIKHVRQQLNKTQAEVAKEADISRSTLSLLERGETGTMNTLIKVLRVLNKLEVFQTFEIKHQISPLALAKLEQKQRQRVKKKGSTDAKKTDW